MENHHITKKVKVKKVGKAVAGEQNTENQKGKLKSTEGKEAQEKE